MNPMMKMMSSIAAEPVLDQEPRTKLMIVSSHVKPAFVLMALRKMIMMPTSMKMTKNPWCHPSSPFSPTSPCL